ncbi:hypothetical protein J7L24_02080 [bacterium]|nr:hypothetical protein [bacterium]
MPEPSQNSEKKLFDSEQPLDETGRTQLQREKEPGFEQGKIESSQISAEKAEPATTPLDIAIPSSAPIAQVQKDKISKDIETILSEDMEEIYKNLPETLQKDFKKKGEETAQEIKNIISQTKIIVSKILVLIKNWLLMVPGVNKFFLEQKSKIKTGKILNLAEKIKNEKIK